MKVCIVGVGAIGGMLGARLSERGECEVSAVARGPTLDSLKTHGWQLQEGGRLIRSRVRATNDARDLGPQDVVIVAVKGPALASAAAQIAPLCGPDTAVVTAMNGVPWWFGYGTKIGDEPLRSVDPVGQIAAAIPIERVIGCVAHLSAASIAPGISRHVKGRRLVIGEAMRLGSVSARVERCGQLLSNAGFDLSTTADIRYEIWYKLWGNMTMNPISAITGASTDQLLADPLVRNFCSAAMEEACEIGSRLGCSINESPEDRHAITGMLGPFKSSMLQDVEARRTIELDGIVTVVREIGQRLGCSTPNIDAILGITRLFGRVRGLYP